jgi:hypothetical protein
MERHFDMVGLLFVVYGVLLVILALVLMIMFGTGASSPADISAAPSNVWVTLAHRSDHAAIALLVLSVPFMVTGWGIRRRAGWARVAALVLGALSILSFPIGTLLGGYALWALTRPDAQAAFV